MNLAVPVSIVIAGLVIALALLQGARYEAFHVTGTLVVLRVDKVDGSVCRVYPFGALAGSFERIGLCPGMVEEEKR